MAENPAFVTADPRLIAQGRYLLNRLRRLYREEGEWWSLEERPVWSKEAEQDQDPTYTTYDLRFVLDTNPVDRKKLLEFMKVGETEAAILEDILEQRRKFQPPEGFYPPRQCSSDQG